MNTFFSLNRDNIIAGIISSAIVSVVAGIIAILSNLPPIPVPAWVVIGVIGFPIGWWVFSVRRRKLKPIVGVTFGVEKVICDGRHFIDCNFDGTEIVFNGTNGFSMQNCGGHITRISFNGNAGIVLSQMVVLYKDPFFKKNIEATLQSIQNQNEIHK
jgi:hypothetical protein